MKSHQSCLGQEDPQLRTDICGNEQADDRAQQGSKAHGLTEAQVRRYVQGFKKYTKVLEDSAVRLGTWFTARDL